MTEDEAFIRTIVDSPDDDLPRLVYADWLDERGDPRGAYLRAEVDWAKAKQTAGFLVPKLHGMATQLDRLWVARISRPPLGVCCDHLKFLQSEPRVSPGDIEDVESEFGLNLPFQYRALLLNYNGGEGVGNGEILETPEGVFAANSSTWWFHPLRQTNHLRRSSVRAELRRRYRYLQGQALPPRQRLWHELYLPVGSAPTAPAPPYFPSVLVAVTGKYWGNVWVSQGDELNDPDFDLEQPRGLQSLPQLLAEHP